MDVKNMTDSSVWQEAVESEVKKDIQFAIKEIQKVEVSDVVVGQENKEMATVSKPESISNEETKIFEKSELNIENLSSEVDKVIDYLQVEDTSLPFGNVMKKQKLDDKTDDLDQQLILSMKDSGVKDSTMGELFKFVTKTPFENIKPSFLEVKADKTEDKYINKSLEDTLNETIKTISNKYIKSKIDTAANDDALSTLANAALNQVFPTNGTGENMFKSIQSLPPVTQIKQKGPAWCDVGVIKGNTCVIKNYYPTSTTDEHESTASSNLPDYTNKLKIDIQPGTAYKFRIAPINACGRGEWSDISVFKTSLPGYPGTPYDVKITKTPYGISLKWEAPTCAGQIVEYTVCLAIKNAIENAVQSQKLTRTEFNFARVYTGPHITATVSDESLGAALIDRTNKPAAIIFRIAAKNEKGYGPATQVRWLQDSNVYGSNQNLFF